MSIIKCGESLNEETFFDGLGNEMAEEMAINAAIYKADKKAKRDAGIWTMRDGTEIKVKDMGEDHIKNTIRMLKRRESEWAESWIAVFEKELEFRQYIRRIASGEL